MGVQVDHYSGDNEERCDKQANQDENFPLMPEHLLLHFLGPLLKLFGVIYIKKVILFISTAL